MGSTNWSIFSRAPDPRVAQILARLRGSGVSAPGDPVADSLRTSLGAGPSHQFHLGYVLGVSPSRGWYRVALAGGGGVVSASRTVSANAARAFGTILPSTVVAVVRFGGDTEYRILGVLPPAGGIDPSRAWPVGGYSGAADPLHGADDFLGSFPFSDTAFDDLTAFDRGELDPRTHVGWVLDPFWTMLLAGPGAGVAVGRIDQLVRLWGTGYQRWTDAVRVTERDDEGEVLAEETSRAVVGGPWTRRFDRGYLGQSETTWTLGPNGDGVGVSHTGLDGSVVSVTAGWNATIKTTGPFPAPSRVRAEDAVDGDDAAAGNYRAAGIFGNGPPHVVPVPDVTYSPDDNVAILESKIAHAYRAHGSDFTFSGTRRPQDTFSRLPTEPALTPYPVDARITGSTSSRLSYVTQQPDGTVRISSGGLASLDLTPDGLAILSAPRGIILRTGGILSALVRDISLQASDHVEIGAGKSVVFASAGGMGLSSESLAIDGRSLRLDGQTITVVAENGLGIAADSAFVTTTAGTELRVAGRLDLTGATTRISGGDSSVEFSNTAAVFSGDVSAVGNTKTGGSLTVGGTVEGGAGISIAGKVREDQTVPAATGAANAVQTVSAAATAAATNAQTANDTAWTAGNRPLTAVARDSARVVFVTPAESAPIPETRFDVWARRGALGGGRAFEVTTLTGADGQVSYPWPGEAAWLVSGLSQFATGSGFNYSTLLPEPGTAVPAARVPLTKNVVFDAES